MATSAGFDLCFQQPFYNFGQWGSPPGGSGDDLSTASTPSPATLYISPELPQEAAVNRQELTPAPFEDEAAAGSAASEPNQRQYFPWMKSYTGQFL